MARRCRLIGRVDQEVIPKFAAYLDLHYPNAEDLCRHLSPLIHKEGINVRYLVRSNNYCSIKVFY